MTLANGALDQTTRELNANIENDANGIAVVDEDALER